MKPKITTLSQAKKRLLELDKVFNDTVTDITGFFDDMGETLEKFSQLKGEIGGRKLSNGKAPEGTSARVMQILRDAGRPMMPKDIVNKHQELGWDEPDGGRAKLYEGVSGSLSYLLNRKQVLEKTKKGYVITSNARI